MDKISRKEAKEQGLMFYYTGIPCIHGHLAERYTNGMVCVECTRLRGVIRYSTESGKEQIKKAVAKYQKTEKGKLTAAKANKKCYERKKEEINVV